MGLHAAYGCAAGALLAIALLSGLPWWGYVATAAAGLLLMGAYLVATDGE
jgi:hypothetical protein